jgi:uncharacterized membrane protein
VSTAQWLLMLHITAAFFFVGAAVAATIFNVLAVRAERPSETAALLKLIRRVLPLMFIGIAGTLIFGIWLWHEQGYALGTWWIWASLVLWVASGALGGAGGSHQEHARELAERLAAEGDVSNDELKAILADPKGAALSYGAGLATLAILVLMIWKP